MFQKLKNLFYFPVASYFRFFAQIRLARWNPRLIVVTGSSGKTTLLHLIESQLGSSARYSFKANSSFGIPFNILDIHRTDLTLWEWPRIFIQAPLALLNKFPTEKIYVVEADCDRPHEGKFLSELLKPEITLWLNVSRTHSMNFEKVSKGGRFDSIAEAIAYEFGYFVEKTKRLAMVNGDSELIDKQLKRVKCKTWKVFGGKKLKKYSINLVGTKFQFENGTYVFPYLLPKETNTSILMCLKLLKYLRIHSDTNFSKFILPPGRSSVFKGMKNITIVDSTYNANLDSMKAVIDMFGKIKATEKWVVLGDMLEQGTLEKEEHEKLADIIKTYPFKRIILMGPRIKKYTFPKLKNVDGKNSKIKTFLSPKEVLDYLKINIKGGEVILFKGARFLEGVIEGLLESKSDVKSLSRREKIWEIRRKRWGL